jgi:hypothetical protein
MDYCGVGSIRGTIIFMNGCSHTLSLCSYLSPDVIDVGQKTMKEKEIAAVCAGALKGKLSPNNFSTYILLRFGIPTHTINLT